MSIAKLEGLTALFTALKTKLESIFVKKTDTVTQSAAGLMSAADKTKLDGIATGANAYTHPTSAGNKHIPSGGSSGQVLAYSAAGTAAWTNVSALSTFGKSGSTAAAGLVPKPSTTAGTTKYLREDGTWQVPPDNNTTYSAATTSAAGLMSAADKTKLDGIATGANAYTHPTTAGNKHIPAGGSSGQVLAYSAAGTAAWTNVSALSTFGKSGSTAAAGLVPKPSTTAGTTKFLCEDATWKTVAEISADYIVAQSISCSDNSVSGYRKWNSGLLEKWGSKTTTSGGDAAVSVSFNTTVLFTSIPVVSITRSSSSSSISIPNQSTPIYLMPFAVTTTGFKIYQNTNSSSLQTCQYYAIGKWK